MINYKSGVLITRDRDTFWTWFKHGKSIYDFHDYASRLHEKWDKCTTNKCTLYCLDFIFINDKRWFVITKARNSVLNLFKRWKKYVWWSLWIYSQSSRLEEISHMTSKSRFGTTYNIVRLVSDGTHESLVRYEADKKLLFIKVNILFINNI